MQIDKDGEGLFFNLPLGIAHFLSLLKLNHNQKRKMHNFEVRVD